MIEFNSPPTIGEVSTEFTETVPGTKTLEEKKKSKKKRRILGRRNKKGKKENKRNDDHDTAATTDIKRGVRFAPTVKVRKISSHRLLKDEQREAIWYSSEECKEIRACAVSTVKRLMKGENVDDDEDDCSRGLEFKTPKKNKIRQTRKLDIIWAVLGEQEVMRYERRPNNPEHLAEIYISHNQPCMLEAAIRGKKDEIEAIRARIGWIPPRH